MHLRKWEANKIPCSHLIAFCAKYNHDATEFMDHFYGVEERYHSYEPIFQSLKDRLEWLEPQERRILMPNLRLIREKGRPKSTRILNEMDETIGSCQPHCGLRMDQSRSVGCVTKRVITVVDVRLEMWNQQAVVVHNR